MLFMHLFAALLSVFAQVNGISITLFVNPLLVRIIKPDQIIDAKA